MKTSIRLVTIPLSVLLAMRNISDKGGREKIKTHILRSINFFSPKIVPFVGKCGKKIVEPDRSHVKIRHMRLACMVTEATNTHLEYVTFLAFSTATVVEGKRLSLRGLVLFTSRSWVRIIVFIISLSRDLKKFKYVL